MWTYIFTLHWVLQLSSWLYSTVSPLTSWFRLLFVGGCPVHRWVIGSISSLYLINASSNTSLPLMTPNVSPDIAKCSLRVKVIPCCEPLGYRDSSRPPTVCLYLNTCSSICGRGSGAGGVPLGSCSHFHNNKLLSQEETCNSGPNFFLTFTPVPALLKKDS